MEKFIEQLKSDKCGGKGKRLFSDLTPAIVMASTDANFDQAVQLISDIKEVPCQDLFIDTHKIEKRRKSKKAA
ncbi:MAG: hypothetical protein A4S09_09595 [Proteobacteria bacterium SG_bin7]|nr:MAG: hypothetical protein A4S09_09595 [Proteobacteria bacterium SG_bin7]